MNQMQMFEGLSYDDILLLPGYADFLPSEARVEVELHPRLRLNIPILSAAMDTVTEKEMANRMGPGRRVWVHSTASLQRQGQAVPSLSATRFLSLVFSGPA